jgi:hypothetical protein
VVLGAICQGVGQLHDRGIVHRDIKPSNILLDGQGRVIVTDFGLSHRRHAAGAGGVAGTPSYMAPEMFQGEVSLRSDVYALGIAAYELLAGAPPFKGALEELSAQHASAPLPFEPLRSAGVSEALFEVLERATHKNAVFRHKTARQFWRAMATAAGFKEDPTKGAAIVAQLVARESGQAPSATARPADDTPSPKSFYDTVGAIAQAKRIARTAAEPWRQESTDPVIKCEPPTVPTIAPTVLPPPPLIPKDIDLPLPLAIDTGAANREPAHSVHCLNCGYDRFGLPPNTACPECGTPDITEQQRLACAALTRHPRRLLWRFLRLGKLPVGWWEVFDSPDAGAFTARGAWITILFAVLFTVLAAATFETVTSGLAVQYTGKAYLYRDGDPERRRVQDYGSGSYTGSPFDREALAAKDRMFPSQPMPGMRSQVTWTRTVHFHVGRLIEYGLYIPLMTLMVGLPWVFFRYGWLNLLLRRRPDLAPATGDAMRRAANAHAMLHVAQGVLFALAILVIFPIAIFATSFDRARQLVWWCWLVLSIAYPILIWRSTFRADRGGRLFIRRSTLTLIPVVVVQFLLYGLAEFISRKLRV